MPETPHVAVDEFPMPLLEMLLRKALKAQDVEGINAVVTQMAYRDPERAEAVRQAILLGCYLASDGRS